MVSALGVRRTEAAARVSVLGAFLPNLTFSGAASKNSQPRIDPNSRLEIPPIPAYSTSISTSVDLFTGLRRLANVRAAGASVEAADAGVVTQRYQVRLATQQAFYTAIATEDLVRVAEAGVRRAQQQLQISIEKLRAGSATRSDSLRSTVGYGNARIDLLQARANRATAQANLGRQIGVDAPVRAVADTTLPALPDTGALRHNTIESAPQVQQAEAQLLAAKANVWSARSPYIPSLTLSLGSSRQDTILGNALVANEVHNWRIGLSWTLFDRFGREQANTQARVRRDNAVAGAADARRAVSAQLTQQLAALATTYEQIEIARATLAAATEDLRVQQERYRVGAATILELLTSQENLTTAEADVVQRRFNYLNARAQLEALIGRAL
jgi:outer membrane protein TolC